MQEQLHLLLKKLVLKNNIQVHQEELKLQLLSHPSYPSLHSITGVLDHFGIPNLAIRLQAAGEIFDQLPKTFIANLTSENGDELVFIEKRKNTVRVTRDNGEKKNLNITEFLELWTGIIVAIEKDESILESKSTSGKAFIKLLLASMAMFALGYVIYSNPGVFGIVHFTASILGLVLSVFIVRQELGLASETLNNFCNLSENTSCDVILNSKGAKLFGLFKLSDLSITVFSGFVLTWLLFSLNDVQGSKLFGVVALTSLPFITFSLYYQYKIAKKWCPLCLGIIAVLVLQLGVLFVEGNLNSLLALPLNAILLFLFAFTTSVGLWFTFKPILMKNNTLSQLEVEHYKFKRNYTLFNAVAKQEKILTNTNEIKGEIIFGNKNASVGLILVTSPFCFYCKKAHSDIEKILKAASSKIKVTIRFRVGSENKESEFYKVVSQVLHIYHTQGQQECLQLLHNLYAEDADLKKWLAETNIHYNPAYDAILDSQSSWCETNGINFTPALYLNERAYPKEYSRTDLIFFLEELIEQKISLSQKAFSASIAS